MQKTCTNCNTTKSVNEFYKSNTSKDGYAYHCKKCVSERSKEKYKINFQKVIDRVKQWRETESGKKHRKIEADKYYKNNTKAISEKRKISREANPDRQKAHHAVNHAVARGVIKKASELQCAYCSKPAKDYHHVAGYSPENWLNVIAVCRSCHRKID